MELDEPIEVYTLHDPYEAEIIRATLRGEGIACELDGERQAGLSDILKHETEIRVCPMRVGRRWKA